MIRPLVRGAAVMLTVALVACAHREHGKPRPDSAFAALQDRGHQAMGVDQYSSTHVFEPLPDGGRISLQRDSADAAGTAQIRAHMQDIAARFAAGDFAIPGFVHARQVPGTVVMTALRDSISYQVDTLPRGAEVRIMSHDSTAIAAIHEFLAFQRMDHRTGDHH